MAKIRYIYFNARDEFYRVDIAKIVYFAAEGNYTTFVLTNKLKGAVPMNLMQTKDLLTTNLKEQAATFARIGRRFIINLSYVYRIEVARQRLTLSDGEHFAFALPISREALRKLKDMYIAGATRNEISHE